MHCTFGAAAAIAALSTLFFLSPTTAQTYTECNPLTQGGCPADPALGKTVNIEFASGASSEFKSSGAVVYGDNGAEFTVAKSGDSPLIQSDWYIMFGNVEFEIQTAPGQGIVSSAVMQSDCLDEIDWEWLGGDNSQVQSNYFGKGDTSTYNRAATHADPQNDGEFHKYTVDWTAEQVVWQIDGVTVRAMPYADADPGQYPQTPMMVKVGAWSGGDPSNPPGTIQWAGGPTNYANGPFTMYLKSIAVTDYSTGTQYTYSGTSGTWQSIQSEGGKINGNDNGGTPVATIAAPAITSAASNSAPMPFEGTHADSTSSFQTPSVWPWVGTATASIETAVATAATTSIPGLPSGWTLTSSGKVLPPSSGAALRPTTPDTLPVVFLGVLGAVLIF